MMEMDSVLESWNEFASDLRQLVGKGTWDF